MIEKSDMEENATMPKYDVKWREVLWHTLQMEGGFAADIADNCESSTETVRAQVARLYGQGFLCRTKIDGKWFYTLSEKGEEAALDPFSEHVLHTRGEWPYGNKTPVQSSASELRRTLKKTTKLNGDRHFRPPYITCETDGVIQRPNQPPACITMAYIPAMWEITRDHKTGRYSADCHKLGASVHFTSLDDRETVMNNGASDAIEQALRRQRRAKGKVKSEIALGPEETQEVVARAMSTYGMKQSATIGDLMERLIEDRFDITIDSEIWLDTVVFSSKTDDWDGSVGYTESPAYGRRFKHGTIIPGTKEHPNE